MLIIINDLFLTLVSKLTNIALDSDRRPVSEVIEANYKAIRNACTETEFKLITMLSKTVSTFVSVDPSTNMVMDINDEPITKALDEICAYAESLEEETKALLAKLIAYICDAKSNSGHAFIVDIHKDFSIQLVRQKSDALRIKSHLHFLIDYFAIASFSFVDCKISDDVLELILDKLLAKEKLQKLTFIKCNLTTRQFNFILERVRGHHHLKDIVIDVSSTEALDLEQYKKTFLSLPHAESITIRDPDQMQNKEVIDYIFALSIHKINFLKQIQANYERDTSKIKETLLIHRLVVESFELINLLRNTTTFTDNESTKIISLAEQLRKKCLSKRDRLNNTSDHFRIIERLIYLAQSIKCDVLQEKNEYLAIYSDFLYLQYRMYRQGLLQFKSEHQFTEFNIDPEQIDDKDIIPRVLNFTYKLTEFIQHFIHRDYFIREEQVEVIHAAVSMNFLMHYGLRKHLTNEKAYFRNACDIFHLLHKASKRWIERSNLYCYEIYAATNRYLMILAQKNNKPDNYLSMFNEMNVSEYNAYIQIATFYLRTLIGASSNAGMKLYAAITLKSALDPRLTGSLNEITDKLLLETLYTSCDSIFNAGTKNFQTLNHKLLISYTSHPVTRAMYLLFSLIYHDAKISELSQPHIHTIISDPTNPIAKKDHKFITAKNKILDDKKVCLELLAESQRLFKTYSDLDITSFLIVDDVDKLKRNILEIDYLSSYIDPAHINFALLRYAMSRYQEHLTFVNRALIHHNFISVVNKPTDKSYYEVLQLLTEKHLCLNQMLHIGLLTPQLIASGTIDENIIPSGFDQHLPFLRLDHLGKNLHSTADMINRLKMNFSIYQKNSEPKEAVQPQPIIPLPQKSSDSKSKQPKPSGALPNNRSRKRNASPSAKLAKKEISGESGSSVPLPPPLPKFSLFDHTIEQRDNGEYDLAITFAKSHLSQAQTIHEEIERTYILANCFKTRANSDPDSPNYDHDIKKAKQLLTQALETLKNVVSSSDGQNSDLSNQLEFIKEELQAFSHDQSIAPPNKQEIKSQAKKLLEGFDTAAALEKFTQLYETGDRSYETLNYLAACHNYLSNFDRALAIYQSLLGAYPQKETIINVNIGECLLNANRLEEAKDHYSSLIDKHENLFFVCKSILKYLFITGQYNECDVYLQKIQTQFYHKPMAKFIRAVYALKFADHELSIALFRELLESEPKNLKYISYYATCLRAYGDAESAKQLLDQHKQRFGTYAPIYVEYARTLREIESVQSAFQFLKQHQKQFPHYFPYQAMLLHLYKNKKHNDINIKINQLQNKFSDHPALGTKSGIPITTDFDTFLRKLSKYNNKHDFENYYRVHVQQFNQDISYITALLVLLKKRNQNKLYKQLLSHAKQFYRHNVYYIDYLATFELARPSVAICPSRTTQQSIDQPLILPEQVRNIFSITKDAGINANLYGGAVFDIITHSEPNDFDFVFYSTSDATKTFIQEKFDAKQSPHRPNLYSAVYNGFPIDITLTDAADINAFLAKRDSDANGFGIDDDGNLLDPFNKAEQVFTQHINTLCRESFENNEIMLLRFIRQTHTRGLRMTENDMSFIKKNAQQLNHISPALLLSNTTLLSELNKSANANAFSSIMESFIELGIIEVLFPRVTSQAKALRTIANECVQNTNIFPSKTSFVNMLHLFKSIYGLIIDTDNTIKPNKTELETIFQQIPISAGFNRAQKTLLLANIQGMLQAKQNGKNWQPQRKAEHGPVRTEIKYVKI